jgi:hypothetical protein
MSMTHEEFNAMQAKDARNRAEYDKAVKALDKGITDHPAAALFPMMDAAAYEELKEDIRKHGLRCPLIILDGRILDGRNRYRACHELGKRPTFYTAPPDVDPVAYVVSANLHRRHLTAEQKKEIIKEVLKEAPAKSNRQVAAQVKVDDKTVGAVRKRLEATAEIPQSTARAGKDGRTINTARIGGKKKAKATPTPLPAPGKCGPPAEKAREPGLFDARPSTTAAVADELVVVEQSRPAVGPPAPAPEADEPVVMEQPTALVPAADWQIYLLRYRDRLFLENEKVQRLVRTNAADRDPAKLRDVAAALRKLADDIERDVLGQ